MTQVIFRPTLRLPFDGAPAIVQGMGSVIGRGNSCAEGARSSQGDFITARKKMKKTARLRAPLKRRARKK